MASVYLARDLKHEREVALKVLRPELAAVIGAERFLAEIKTTANLPHWAPDGNSIYYFRYGLDGSRLWEARIDRGPPVAVLDRDSLMAWPDRAGISGDLHPDGDRFITWREADGSGPEESVEEVRYFVVTNWFEEMRARLGGG